MPTVSAFMDRHFRHFNARETLDAARAWTGLIDRGGEMFLAMAGAMSTGEIGISLAEMIRRGKVSAVCSTAANLEEDLFNLFAHDRYRMVPNYRELTPAQELELRGQRFNRVTDTCIPEDVMIQMDRMLLEMWQEAAGKGEPRFPWEFMYALLDAPGIEEQFKIPREHSWVVAAKEKGIPVYTPGWEDSTLGNIYTGYVIQGRVKDHSAVKSGTAQLQHLAGWYLERMEREVPVGFFQIGGGIAGDFAICVVPMLIQDVKKAGVPFWAYFAQIGDSTTSYGSYSGAVPNEKITWSKLGVDTPKFMIDSDASIVAPLIFAYVLGE